MAIQNHRALRHLSARKYAEVSEVLSVAETYNSQNRSVSYWSGCCYIPDHPDESPGCAIGRRLNDEEKKMVIDLNLNYNCGVKKLARNLGGIEYFKGFSMLAMVKLQALHDYEPNWCGRGLSERGGFTVLGMINHLLSL